MDICLERGAGMNNTFGDCQLANLFLLEFCFLDLAQPFEYAMVLAAVIVK